MALNKKETVETKSAVAPKAPTAPTSGDKKPKATSKLSEAGKAVYQSMSVEQQQHLGSRSKDVEFLNLIGNPYNKVARGDNKGSESVGLILKNVSDEPIDVLKFAQKSKKSMDADYAHPTYITVAPGEEFILTWAEAGAFAVRDEFNGFILGSKDKSKHLRYTPNSSKAGGVPTTKFILAGGVKGSIADHVIDIATPEEMERRDVSPRFEEFRAFAIPQRTNSGVSMKREGGGVNSTALAVNKAFQELINSGSAETAETAE